MTSLPSLIKHRNETYLTVCLINMWTNFLVEDAKHHQLTNCNFIGFCNARRIIDMQLSGTFSIPCRLEMLRSLVLSGSGAFANCDLLVLVVCVFFVFAFESNSSRHYTVIIVHPWPWSERSHYLLLLVLLLFEVQWIKLVSIGTLITTQNSLRERVVSIAELHWLIFPRVKLKNRVWAHFRS